MTSKPILSSIAGAALAITCLATGQLAQAGGSGHDETHAVTCTAALMIVGWTRKTNGQPYEAIADNMALWKGRVQRHSDAQIGAVGETLQQKYSMSEIEVMAQDCGDEVSAANADICGRYAKTAADDATWYFKAAAGQAALARGLGGNLGAAQGDIRLGCDILSKARRRMRESLCPSKLITAMDDMYEDYILDVPGPNGSARLECPKAR